MSKLHSYALIDSGEGRKLERFGPYLLSRPCSQAVWKPQLSMQEWNKADAFFSREQENKWTWLKRLPEKWQIEVAEIIFKISPTDFGHLGIFPEQRDFWEWIQTTLKPFASSKQKPRVLNLFAYSGGSTLAAAKAGAAVCHLDASKGMVAWARENAALNQLEQAPIRWIVEDVKKFLARELKRGSRYDAIILDPPTFGRGAKGELFKIEDEIVPLLNDCRKLLSDQPLFVLFSCHTPGFSPLVMQHLLNQAMEGMKGHIEVGEMILTGHNGAFDVPSGTYARWAAPSISNKVQGK
ncbi:class I SAM-dependent methyltransferase [Candidatus Protochlamydia phocaeensis]|uniref:class I SAM-dependent methyltransferase n=1 Tax=Candidatus Protochlamydia phocaeensis TaxID=1414722 RepID=UPI000838F92F|nr:class I SAM-dependent methyltransferase [Candidatus Protochlamydia phocaeensis]